MNLIRRALNGLVEGDLACVIDSRGVAELIIISRSVDQSGQVDHLAIAIDERNSVKRPTFVRAIGSADDVVVNINSVGHAPIAKEVIISERPEIVHGRAVVKKSVVSIVKVVDRRFPHDVSVRVDGIPNTEVSRNGSDIPHAACGIPDESVSTRASCGPGFPCDQA